MSDRNDQQLLNNLVHNIITQNDDGIAGVGVRGAMNAMTRHWSEQVGEGHDPKKIVLSDIESLMEKLAHIRDDLKAIQTPAEKQETIVGRVQKWMGDNDVVLKNEAYSELIKLVEAGDKTQKAVHRGVFIADDWMGEADIRLTAEAYHQLVSMVSGQTVEASRDFVQRNFVSEASRSPRLR